MNIESIELVNVFFILVQKRFCTAIKIAIWLCSFTQWSNTNSGFSFGFGFFANATIAHTERKSYIEKSQSTDTNHQVQYHSHAVYMNDKLLLVDCWFFLFYFSFAIDVIMIILNRLTEHILKYKTRSHIYMVAHVIRCAYLIFFLHTLLTCVGSFVFSKSKLIHVAGYTIYFCIISKIDFHCLLLFVCFILFFSHLVDLMTCRWFEWIYFPFQTQNDRITH